MLKSPLPSLGLGQEVRAVRWPGVREVTHSFAVPCLEMAAPLD